MKYKVGDKVKVRSKTWWDKQPMDSASNVNLKHEYFTYIAFNDTMIKYCGKMVHITKIDPVKKTYSIDEDSGFWSWSDEMFEPAYTYAELDLPDWWDGRPVLGYVSDISEEEAVEKKRLWYVWPDFFNKEGYSFRGVSEDKTREGYWRYFVPYEKQDKSVKLTVTDNGESREVELTEEQIKQLGL